MAELVVSVGDLARVSVITGYSNNALGLKVEDAVPAIIGTTELMIERSRSKRALLHRDRPWRIVILVTG